MARILFPDGTQETDLPKIQTKLAELKVALRGWATPIEASAHALLEKPVLNDEEKVQVLASVDHRFQSLKEEQGYTTRDLIVLHEGIGNLSEIMAKFEKIHIHTDDEVRYIVAGKGYFGFVDKQGGQYLVEVVGGDYINVPANTEHWFTLGDSKRIKAVRYFIDTSGWTPVYTDRALEFKEKNVPWAVPA